MLVKVSNLDEGFPTLLTFIRLLPRMNSLVHTEGLTVAKGLATCTALIRFLSRVTSTMTDEG